jgi:hypothetical protein
MSLTQVIQGLDVLEQQERHDIQEYIRNFDGNGGFMYTIETDPEKIKLKEDMEKLLDDSSHSGASWGWMMRVIQSVLSGVTSKEEILKQIKEDQEESRRKEEEDRLKTEIIIKPIFVNKKTYAEIEYDNNECEFVVNTLRKWFKHYHIDVDTINETCTTSNTLKIYESEKKGIFKIEGINGEYRRFVNIIYSIREDNALYVDYEYDGSEKINISNEKENSYLKFQIMHSLPN